MPACRVVSIRCPIRWSVVGSACCVLVASLAGLPGCDRAPAPADAGLAIEDAGPDVEPEPDATWHAETGETVPDVGDAPDDAVAPDAEPADSAPRVVDAGPKSPFTATGGFVDVTAALGPQLALDPGDKGQKEPAASAGLLTDLDKDGIVDYVLVDGLTTARWGRALQPWKWQPMPLFTAKEPGLRAIAVTDGDGDGYPEIVLGGGKLHYLVRKPDETYVDEALARGLEVQGKLAVQAVVPADVDSDGLLDLVVALYSCDQQSQVLAFVNQGDATYANRTYQLGIDHYATLWQVLATDVDGDRHIDLLAMNEGCEPFGGNAYLHNRGWQTGKPAFEKLTLPPVFMAPDKGGGTPMGGSVGDVDGDGDLDYLFSDIGYREQRMGGMDMRKPDLAFLAQDVNAGNHLLVRQADGGWQHAALQAGLNLALNANGQTMVSWSARLFDVDGDGHLDVLMNHGFDFDGFLLGDDGGARPVLFRNQGDATFVEMSKAFGLPDLHLSHAMAASDLDRDGDLDFLMGGQTLQPLLLRNDVVHGNQWLTVELRGKVSNAWGLGARVELKTDVRQYVAEMTTNAPTQTADEAVVHFGVPAGEQPLELWVRWPSGFDQQVAVAQLGQHLVVHEPPLVKLSARKIASSKDATVEVHARAFDATGQFLPQPKTIAIELAAGGQGSWKGPLQCQPNGECLRQWQPPQGGQGEVAFVVEIGGQALSIRPRVRYAPLGFGP